MESYYLKNTKEIKKEKELLEKKLGVKICIKGKQITIEGPAVNEYEASIVMEALEFGFSARKSLVLLSDDMIFRRLHIRDFTRKKNLKEVKARIIGKEGKTKRTIESIADCEVKVVGNEMGIICNSSEIEEVTTAVTNLIRGTKASNVYGFLEKMNKERKKYND